MNMKNFILKKKLFAVMLAATVWFFGASVIVYASDSDLNNNGTPDSQEAEVVVNSNATLPAGSYEFNNLVLENNAVLVAGSNPNSSNDFKGVKITATNLTVSAGSSINADAKGDPNGPGTPPVPPDWGGASYGGAGEHNSATSTYGSAMHPTNLGSGEDAGGAVRIIVSGMFSNNGSVSANAAYTGSGGSIYVTADTLAGIGSFSANGGFVGSYNYVGAGGGGRIAVHFRHSSFVGSAAALGGTHFAGWASGYKYGAGGTVAFFDMTDNVLHVDSAWRFLKNDGPFSFNGISLTGSGASMDDGVSITANEMILDETTSLTVSNNAVLSVAKIVINGNSQMTLSGTETLTVETLKVTNGGTVTVLPQQTLSLTIPNITVSAGSSINADGKGDPNGPGMPPDWGGASYGGVGEHNTATSTYGSAMRPTDLGSGAGSGGAIRIVASGTLINDGMISANTSTYSDGSGGSVFVTAGILAGAGSFSANGGHVGSYNYVGAGGGGRVAVYYQNSSFAGNATALGGTHFTGWGGPEVRGGDGTVVMEEDPTISFGSASITEDDGIQDGKGVADKTKFTFSVTASEDLIDIKLVTDSTDIGINPEQFFLYASGTEGVYSRILTFPKGHYRYHFEAGDGNGGTYRYPETTELEFTTGYSNVAFLPGIEASRLYSAEILNNQPHGDEDQLWEPNGYLDVEDLFLPENGKSSDGVYTKTSIAEGVIGEVNITPILQGNIYKSFLLDFEKWKNTDHVFADYRVIPYDWRLSIDDILNNGTESNGRLYYSDEPDGTKPQYVLNQLRQLAANSDTGKVTVIAHSNGGLVAKALLKRLGDVNDPLLSKIDNTIFVAVPQFGTPQAIGALFHGFEQSLPFDWFPLLLDSQTARAFASTSPMAYHLLPSPAYINSTGVRITTPVATFDDGALAKKFKDAYGYAIGNATELHNFLLGNEGRQEPIKADTTSPSTVKPDILAYGELIHQEIDNWVPPMTMNVYQIAGWGEDTLGGLHYWDGTECTRKIIGVCVATQPKLLYTPEDVIDGDGTVVTPSALAVSTSSPNVSRWWVNLGKYNDDHWVASLRGLSNRDHSKIFEVPELRNFIKNNILIQTSTSLPAYLSSSVPQIDEAKRLRYFLHSPLALSAHDQNGNEISAENSAILGARFKRYGEVQSISVPADIAPTLVLNGKGEGSFTLEIQEVQEDIVIATTTFSGIPSSPNTKVTMEFPDGTIQNASVLEIDENGDGMVDFSYTPKLGQIVTPDMTPPEAKISVDSATKDLLIEGIDENPTTVSKNGNTYTITDSSGNKTTLFFQKTFASKRLTFARLTGVQYGNDPKISLPSSSFIYLWNPTLVSQTVAVKKDFIIEAMYDKKKNQTTVFLKKKGEKVQKQTFVGLKVVKLVVNKGVVGYEI
jgi:pimeloyl-ACP methyl ester carboxylesterase